MRDISVNETSKLIKQTLRKAFPGTKFSVRLDKYSMGCSIDASWIDGPTDSQVAPIMDRFNGKYFDGMDDSTHYVGKRIYLGEEVDFHSGYVRGQRRVSVALMETVAARVAQETGQPVPAINVYANVVADHNLRVSPSPPSSAITTPFERWGRPPSARHTNCARSPRQSSTCRRPRRCWRASR